MFDRIRFWVQDNPAKLLIAFILVLVAMDVWITTAQATPQSSSVSSILDDPFKWYPSRPIPSHVTFAYCTMGWSFEIPQGSLIPPSRECRVLNYYDSDWEWMGVLKPPEGGTKPFRVPWTYEYPYSNYK